MRLPAFVLALALAVVAAAPATAAPLKASDDEVVTGPVLAGGQVVYLTRVKANYVLQKAAPGAQPQTLQSYPAPVNDDDCCFTTFGLELAGSPTRLATLLGRQSSAKGQVVDATERLSAGPIDGPATDIYSCQNASPFFNSGFDLDGDRLAIGPNACPGQPDAVVIRDLATGADVATVPQGSGRVFGQLKLAGHYLAVAYASDPSTSTARRVLVRDLSTGTDVTDVAGFDSFGVQADGKLVVTDKTPGAPGCSDGVEWYAPGDATPHPLGMCAVSAPRIAADRVLVARQAPPGGKGAELVLSDLSGNARVVARADSHKAIGAGYQLDATHAAYSVGSCTPGRGLVYLDDLAPADPMTVATDCPVKPRGGKLRPTRSNRVVVTLACPKGCGGFVNIDSGSLTVTPDATFAGPPGNVRVSLRLGVRARRLLARRGRLGVRIDGTFQDLTDDSSGNRFSQAATLLPARAAR
jgi:hypothetical protein